MNHTVGDRRGRADAGDLPLTLGDIAHRRLRAACSILGTNQILSRAREIFDVLADPWRNWNVEYEPYWLSDVTDDGSPFELSIAFGGKSPELRLLAECQEPPLTSESGWL